MPSSVVTSKGQITIPVEVRQRLGLATGHRVDYVDCLIQRLGAAAGCRQTVTFDRLPARLAGMRLLGA